ncbi:MAG TPA: hypothetical protein PLY16_01640 [Candidatus Saccharibacteria bacterium]|nr:hypothetical protein [Candidatus Saccharibacteria bacterium]
MELQKNIANAIRNNDFPLYQRTRYPHIQDGDVLVFEDEDFSGVNFEQFSMGFAEFYNCNLDNAKYLHGQPVKIEGGSAKNLDLRGVGLILQALECDFSGLKYNESTQLSYGEGGQDAYSVFSGCTVDSETVEYFKTQGVDFS